MPPDLVAVGQRPGQQCIAYYLPHSNDVLLLVVEDNPSLRKDQMLIRMDIDPYNGVTWSKSMEAWGDCKTTRYGQSVASLRSGVDVGRDCHPLDANWKSGCTVPGAWLTLEKSQGMNELWLRKPGFLGIWVDAAVMDPSIWDAFGGRTVRFIWRFN